VDQGQQHEYVRVATALLARIQAGEFGENGQLPSITAIAQQYGVAKNTAQQAIQSLSRRGLVVSRSGSGTFVRPRPAREVEARLKDRVRHTSSPYAEEKQEQNRTWAWDYRSRTLEAPQDIRDRLGLPEAAGHADVLRTDYVFYADGEPATLSTSWEPLDLTRGTEIFMPEEGLYAGKGVEGRMLVIGVLIDRATENVGARVGSDEECRQLRIPAGSIVLDIEREYRSGDRVVEVADIVYAADTKRLGYSWRVETADDADAGQLGQP
jgi:DNA-binding GntR family transcriptional regulator